jgi:hypothetical protein
MLIVFALLAMVAAAALLVWSGLRLSLAKRNSARPYRKKGATGSRHPTFGDLTRSQYRSRTRKVTRCAE